MASNTYVALATQTLSSGAASVTLSSIPQGYTDLVLVMRVGASSSGQGLTYQLNGDTSSNYSVTAIRGNGTAASSFRQSNNSEVIVSNFAEPPTSGFATYIVNFQNYSNTTTNKTSISRGSAGGSGVDALVGLWLSTAAINSILIKISGGTMSTGSTFTLYGIAAAPVPNTGTAKATGGTISYDQFGYVYHTFTSNGTFTPSVPLTAEVLLVAGGGGAGENTNSGGGGAGGLLYLSNQSLLATGYSATVGAGGAGGSGGVNAEQGYNGSNSTLGALTAAIGGGGGAGGNLYQAGSSGGSGGGGSGAGGSSGITGAGGSGTSGQGNSGATGVGGVSGSRNGGGGGGAGGAGGVGTRTNGGIGSSLYSAWGAITNTGQNVSGICYYAGGGAGNGDTAGTGGLGGGGTAATASGTANTGGGGAAYRGAGGSGLIIVKYYGL